MRILMITRSSGKCELYKMAGDIPKLCSYLLGKVSKLKGQAQKGEDTFGNQYGSIGEMWRKELSKGEEAKLAQEAEVAAAGGEALKGRVGDEETWYKKQVEYWDA